MKLTSCRFLILIALTGSTVAALTTPDRVLRGNMQVDYLRKPAEATSWSEWLAQGTVYGRVRTHFFAYDWDTEKDTGGSQTRDNDMWGLGGSLIWKSARWQGWSVTLGAYSTVPLHDGNTDARVPLTNFGKSGKDTYRTRPDGTEAAIHVLAEAYAEYAAPTWTVRAGRQIIDSMLLSSNDSKMIPQTFEAARFDLRLAPSTKFTVATVLRDKLRDHTTFHSLIAYAKPTGNDDSAAHRGLTPQNLARAGKEEDPVLWLATVEAKPRSDLKLAGEVVALPGEFATVAVEAVWEIKLADGWVLSPAARVLRQFDRGAGAVGGASLTGCFALDKTFTTSAADLRKLASYSDPRSVDGGLWATRAVLTRGPLGLTVGMAEIADEADIIAPWRGFPTGGYTRLMAQVDWQAANSNWMTRIDYDFGKTRVTSSLKASVAYVRIDCDARKIAEGTMALTDRGFTNCDVTAVFHGLPQTEFKVRFGSARADAKPSTTDPRNYESYREMRFEMNHLF